MIPLVAPWVTWEDREYVKGRIDEGLLENEDEVRALEQAFAARFGYADAVAVNSGTNALIAALDTLARKPQWVAFPSYSCRAIRDAISVAHVAIMTDNHCNIAAADYQMLATSPLSATTATVRPWMFGRAPTIPVADPIIEDITLSLGTPHSPTNMAVCSLQADKMISAGRGGIILIPKDFASVVGELRARVSYDTHPDDLTPAHSFAMSSTQAALALSQLRRLDEMIERRRETASYYTRRLEGFDRPQITGDNVFFRYLIGVKDPAACVDRLAQAGIEAGRGVYPPIHQIIDGLDPEPWRGAEECANRLLSLPVHPGVRNPRHIADSVIELCQPG